MKLHKLKTGLVHGVVFLTTRSLSASLQKLSSSTKAVEILILDAWLTSRRPGTRRTSPWKMFSHFEPDISEQQAQLYISRQCCTRKKLSFQSCSVYSIYVLAMWTLQAKEKWWCQTHHVLGKGVKNVLTTKKHHNKINQ